jgi:hypothetical protein
LFWLLGHRDATKCGCHVLRLPKRLHCCCLYAGLRQGRRAKNCRKALASAALEKSEAYSRKTNVAYVRKKGGYPTRIIETLHGAADSELTQRGSCVRTGRALKLLQIAAPALRVGAIRHRNG